MPPLPISTPNIVKVIFREKDVEFHSPQFSPSIWTRVESEGILYADREGLLLAPPGPTSREPW